MNLFFQLFLAHMIGDYVFQISFIAKYKNIKKKVLLLHILVIFLTNVLIITPNNFNNFFLIFILSLTHLLIDFTKFSLKKIEFFSSSSYYVIDQVMHIISLVIVSYFMIPQNTYINDRYSFLISFGLFNAYFLGILSSFIFSSIKNYKRDRVGYIIRFLFSFINNIFVFIIFMPVSLFIVKYFYEKKDGYNIKEIYFSLSLTFLFCLITLISLEVKL